MIIIIIIIIVVIIIITSSCTQLKTHFVFSWLIHHDMYYFRLIHSFIHSFSHSGHFYSAPSSPLPLRGAPDYSTDTVSEFHAEAHRQLQVKDLPKVPT